MKVRPVGAELFHADGQTYTTKLIVAFRNFAYTLKKGQPSSTIMFQMPYFYAARLPGRNINALWQNFLYSQDVYVCSQPGLFLKR